MKQNSPYDIIKNMHITEKTQMLQELKSSDSNACIRRCEKPKYVFIVNPKANKFQIREAIEEIYKDNKIKVTSVNTINMQPRKRRSRGKLRSIPGFKKAIVTLEPNDSLDKV